MSFQQQYRQKRRSAADAAAEVRDGDTVIVPTGAGEPPGLLTALSERRRELRGVRVGQILPLDAFDYFDPATAEHIRPVGYFLGPASRPGAQQGWVDTLACHFSELPQMIRRGLTPADVVFSVASPMDEHGFFSLSLGADYTMAAVERARAVVLEVNANAPFANGNCHVHISQLTALVETEVPIREVGAPSIGPIPEAIGSHVAEMIEDGSTLQIGYGSIPDAVVMQLRHKRDLGIHSEMMGDGLLSLIECGAVTHRRRNYLPGKAVATFVLGSARLYRYVHRNPAFEVHPADFTNDPYLAGQNDRLVSINATLQVDLFGQCGSESLGLTPYSGTGGQSDFVRAANRSRGGQSFIVLPSTAKDGRVSRIVPTLDPGTLVSTSKNDVNYVVTEFGVAQLRGKSMRERARALIGIAHPDFRAQLQEQAQRLKLL
ncbi:acetyl-CoA hydrolase/transferase family protein [Roseateles cellulosilyticus]|uniref:4-hydroxybutyrate CoA-transferase n=1 Tax=Pelomonas cellulosilytica TaxID=2906762 RepID=A0ABS8XME5_9BURK|nr:acetyl-CoA hydrolase/transferase C-terminal domain-containing protein [Pelomonas sp. P8]MCE4552905.1 4-hydroxybutyrate CoA-transferase [Pelomonas sp. P8]